MEDIAGDIGPGTTLGPFEIEKVLGKGGMGVVYKAHEPSLNRKVALKVLSDTLSSNEEYIARFKKEARIIASLNHPNIVGVLSFGKDLGHYYFAMDYIKGMDLGQILKERTVIPIDEALGIVRQIADALSEAGGKGVVHRDLKPSNIMIDEMNRVRVTDFGVARLEDSTDGLTKTGMFLGTPEYASPEQATGKPIDLRSDIYSLGAMFYRMLSGKPPIVGDSPLAVVAKIATEPVTPIGLLNSSVSRPVSDLIEKMMAKDVRDRFQTPGEVCSAIDECEKLLREERGSLTSGGGGMDPKKAFPSSKAEKSGSGFLRAGGILLAAVLLIALFLSRDRWFSQNPEVSSQKSGVETTTSESPPDLSEAVQEAAAPTSGEATVNPEAASSAPEAKMLDDQALTVKPIKEVHALSSGESSQDGTLQTTSGPMPDAFQRQPQDFRRVTDLPETPTILLMVSGPEEMTLLMRPYLESALLDDKLQVISPAEIPLLRQKMQFGDMPVSWYDIRQFVPDGMADILVLTTIQTAGTTTLKFYGRTQEQVTAVFSIRTLDMDSGAAVDRSRSGQVKYTVLTLEEAFQEALEGSVENLGKIIQAYWRTKRSSEAAAGKTVNSAASR